jgi:hypothetical protein
MTTQESAQHQNPSLFCAFFGGPRDGCKTEDLLITVAGSVCTPETQIEGFWHSEEINLVGPTASKSWQSCLSRSPDQRPCAAPAAEPMPSDHKSALSRPVHATLTMATCGL